MLSVCTKAIKNYISVIESGLKSKSKVGVGLDKGDYFFPLILLKAFSSIFQAAIVIAKDKNQQN